MTIIRRPSVIGDVVQLRDMVDRFFDERLFRPIWSWNGERNVVPALDLSTTPDAVIAKIALPGVKPEAVDVSIADDVVTVKGSFGEEKESSEEGYVVRELSRGEFVRSFAVPTPIKAEGVTATFEHGLLTLTLPKSDKIKPTHVKIELAH